MSDRIQDVKGYDEKFFGEMVTTSGKAAQYIVPDLVKLFKCKSVLDLGCGTGEWLLEWKKSGVKDILGVDGDYVDRKTLKISGNEFSVHNLETPFDAGRKFDFAMSVEVAEHLPEEAADNFVTSLTRHSDIIMFSAAVPGQVGTWHINEQWQEYWQKKFEAQGYETIDYVRKKWWLNPHIVWWYRQNIFLYIKKDTWTHHPELLKLRSKYSGIQMPLIHPDFDFHLKGISGNIARFFAKPGYIITKFIYKVGYTLFK